MKRIYTTLALLGAFSLGAQAQRHCDVELVHVFGPLENTTVTCTQDFLSGYIFVNNGPDDILATDSFWVRDGNPAADQAYKVIATGIVENGMIDANTPSPAVTVGVGDTIILYKWNDQVSRLKTLRSTASPYEYVYPDAAIFDNGDYLYPIEFLGFNKETEVVDTFIDNNFAWNKITINCTTGLNDLLKGQSKTQLNVYPNPANNTISFNYAFDKATTATIRISDITGRTVIVKETGKNSAGEKKFTVDVAALHTGTYFVELVTEEKRGISKFTVQH